MAKAYPVLIAGGKMGLLKFNLMLALVYFAFAVFSIELFRLGNSIAVIWFANAVGIAVLSRLNPVLWPLPMLSLAASIIAANYMTGVSLSNAVLFMPGNLLEITLGAYLLRRGQGDAGYFYNQISMLSLLARGTFFPVLAGAIVAGGVFCFLGNGAWLSLTANWLEGSAIGGVSVLPLAYWLSVHGCRALYVSLRQSVLPVLLIFAIAVSLLAPITLPFPFIYISLPLFYIAHSAGLPGILLANFLVSMTICIQISLGMLLPPPSIYSWGHTLLYLPILATLLPPLLLAISMEMNRSAVAALQHSERRYRSLYQNTPALLFSCDPEGHIVSVNDLWLRATGFAYAEVIGSPATQFLSPESARQMKNEITPRLLQEGVCHNVAQQIVKKAGGYTDVLMTAALERNEQGMISRVLVVQLDISDKLRAQYQASHDTLTQLPNRLLFTDRIERACQQGERNHEEFCVVFVDLDHFKEINDSYGHELGDQLLIEMARRLAGAVRSSDTVSRLGGDEFVLLLAGLGPGKEAEQMAEKIRSTIAQPCLLGDQTIVMSVSMGLAYYPRDGRDVATLMRNADEAMYCSKRHGRNCFSAYTPS